MDEIYIEHLRLGIRALRLLHREMRMSRLKEKLAAAAAVAPRLEAKFEARADAIIARESGLDQRGDHAFTLHEARLDDAGSAVDAVEAALSILTNGGPPLGLSTPSPIVSPLPGSTASAEPTANGDAPQKDVFHE